MQSLRQGYEATQRHASGLTNTDYKAALAAKRKAKKEYWGRQTTSIYALIDPRNQSYRYIGKSNFVDLRYGQQLDKATTNAKKKAWVNELKTLGFQPQLRVLEKCDLQVWKKRERYWISVYKESGLLLNLTDDGGDGDD